MPNYLSRNDALALIVNQRSPQIIQGTIERSLALQTFRRINVGTQVYEFPVIDALPQAAWLAAAAPDNDVDVAKKPTTVMSWSKETVKVEEIAAIALIPENVIDDSSYPIESEVETRVAEAIAVALDKAVFFGEAFVGSIPASFPVGGLHGRAVANGKEVDGTADLWLDFSAAMAEVEADGYDPARGYAGRQLRGGLRTMVSKDGVPLYVPSVRQSGGVQDSVLGVNIDYVSSAAWNPTKSALLIGDPSLAVILVRQDLTVKRLTEATVGGYNLAEQDMIGIRVRAPFGFYAAAPAGRGQTATPFPFATVKPFAG